MRWLLLAAALGVCCPGGAAPQPISDETAAPVHAAVGRRRRGPAVVRLRPARPGRDAAAAGSEAALLLVPGAYPLRAAPVEPGDGTAWAEAMQPLPLPAVPAPPGPGSGSLPSFSSQQPLYVTVPLGGEDGGALVALDESGGTGTGYDRLYADADRDGQLAGEAAVSGRLRRAGAFLSVDFEEVELPAAYAGVPARQLVRVRLHGYRLDGGEWCFSYALAECRVGEIATPRGPVQVVLADTAMRAAYDRRCAYRSAVPTGDGAGPQVWLSPDPAAPGVPGGVRRLSLGAAQLIGGQLYSFEPSAAGDVLVVRRYDGAAGRARVGGANAHRKALPVTEITLLGSAGRYELDGCTDQAPTEQPLPQGEYYAITEVRQEDREGGEWIFRFRSRDPFQLAAAAEVQLAVGGPLRAAIAPGVAHLAVRRGEELPLKLLFLTEADHELFGFDRPPPGSPSASIVIRSRAGTVVARSGSGFA
jgi:hypothetical protein